MRELKFRQAIKAQGKLPFRWHYWGYLHTNELDDFTPPLAKIDGDERPSYQYIGRKDKNDKEIYDDDIIKRHNSELGNVIYENCYFTLHRWGDWHSWEYIEWVDQYFENCEVIGNGTENPELLERINNRE